MEKAKTTIWKSLVAGLGAGVTAAIPYSSDGLNLQELLIIAGAFIATQQATYWTPRYSTQKIDDHNDDGYDGRHEKGYDVT
jgi:hypothetical protein